MNPKAGFGSPNAGCGEECVDKVVGADELNENPELDDDPNVNGELPEPGGDSPKENPVDEDVVERVVELPEPGAESPNENPVEVDVEPKIDEVDA